MTLRNSISNCLKKYATFSGRACRSEFWWWVAFTHILSIAIAFGAAILFNIGIGVFCILTLILIFLTPNLAVAVRRCHDTNHSGWWILCPFYSFVLMVIPSDPDENDYGFLYDTKEEVLLKKTTEIEPPIDNTTKFFNSASNSSHKNLNKKNIIVIILVLICSILLIQYFFPSTKQKEYNTSSNCPNVHIMPQDSSNVLETSDSLSLPKQNKIVKHEVTTKQSHKSTPSYSSKPDSINIPPRPAFHEKNSETLEPYYYVYFKNGMTNIDDNGLITIMMVADRMQEDASLYAYITGYNDSTNTKDTTTSIGYRRANNVMKELRNEYQISSNRIFTTVDKLYRKRNSTSYAPTRRVSIRLVDKETFVRLKAEQKRNKSVQ